MAQVWTMHLGQIPQSRWTWSGCGQPDCQASIGIETDHIFAVTGASLNISANDHVDWRKIETGQKEPAWRTINALGLQFSCFDKYVSLTYLLVHLFQKHVNFFVHRGRWRKPRYMWKINEMWKQLKHEFKSKIYDASSSHLWILHRDQWVSGERTNRNNGSTGTLRSSRYAFMSM